MSKVRYINAKAKTYHEVLNHVDTDLYLLVCEDLSREPLLLTRDALDRLKAKLGRCPYLAVPISPEAAAALGQAVLVADDVDALKPV